MPVTEFHIPEQDETEYGWLLPNGEVDWGIFRPVGVYASTTVDKDGKLDVKRLIAAQDMYTRGLRLSGVSDSLITELRPLAIVSRVRKVYYTEMEVVK